MLAPLERHADDGFGATASSFRSSAEQLLREAGSSPSLTAELPVCFLLRHAVELFLKSGLVVLHRRFSGDAKNKDPLVLVGSNRKPMTTVHGLQSLYNELGGMLFRYKSDMAALSSTQWLPMPTDLDAAIAEIDGIDASSSFFRYPSRDSVGSDSAKSSFKRISLEELENWSKRDRGYLKAFLVVDEKDEVVEAFHYAPGSLSNQLVSLQVACDWLHSIHVGLRMEFADGW